MKNLTIALGMVLLLGTGSLFAQIKVPQPSPTATFSSTIGLTDVSIEYSRPSKKERVIFGGLVPYDKIWRTGANASTKISFSDDVMINDQKVPAGKYAIYTIPGESSWVVAFHKNLMAGGSNFNEEEDLLRINVKPQTVSGTVETFTIGIESNKTAEADLFFLWDQTYVAFTVKAPIDETVKASIERTLNPGAGAYYSAARYYAGGEDLNKALEYYNIALAKYKEAGRKPFWVYHRKALVQAELGDTKGAISTAEESLAMAREEKSDDYIVLNEEVIKKWKGK
jgi:Protein of unknown function (DUF2911)